MSLKSLPARLLLLASLAFVDSEGYPSVAKTQADFYIHPVSHQVTRHGNFVGNLFRGSLFDKKLVITIDDGPRDVATDNRLFSILNKHGVKAIWFVNCDQFSGEDPSKSLPRREFLERLIRDGHRIGNHSYHHVDLAALFDKDPAAVAKEIRACSAAIENTVGVRPRYFRPPWGRLHPSAEQYLSEDRLQLLLWTTVILDTNSAQTQEQFEHALFGPVLNSIDDGDVILMHDTRKTAEVLDEFLLALHARGFEFVLPD